MRFVDEYRSNEKVQTLLEAIRKKVTRPWYIMEICGGQTHAIARYRLEEMLPPDIQLLHGPGCPVCVTPVETIDYALKLATQPNVILASFGDMMRVPGSKEDLLSVKARGADIRMLYTPLDALSLAEENPDKEIVFFAIGFETTAPVHLMALKEAIRRGLPNFSILTSLSSSPLKKRLAHSLFTRYLMYCTLLSNLLITFTFFSNILPNKSAHPKGVP